MTTDTLLTPEVRAMIGREGRSITEEVEKGAIRRWAKAVFDTDPLHTDEAYAKSKGYAGLVAPPSFLWGHAKGFVDEEKGLEVPHKGRSQVAGGEDWEYFLPVVAGDVITRRQRISDIYEKQGKAGKMAFIVTEVTFTNQRGQLVARLHNISIAVQ